jgi:DNA-binding MarR family transcriptional regulator
MANAAGRRARQLPTAEQLAVWRRFIETSEQLRSAIAARLQTETGLSPGDYSVLLALSEAEGHRMRSSALAEHIGWERSRVSHHLGRMERRGLLAREDCPTDSRGAEAVLTPAGAAAFHGATVPHLRAIRELFVDGLTDDQLDAVDDVVAALRANLDAAPS